MISVYILRHGEAERDGATDAGRPLTKNGKQQVYSSAQHLPAIDLMVVSPYVRAQESAQLIEALFTSQGRSIGKQQDSETLVPESSTNAVMGWLEDVDAKSMLLVSHNPLVTELTHMLTGENSVRFGTGTLVHLSGDLIAPGCMRVASIY